MVQRVFFIFLLFLLGKGEIMMMRGEIMKGGEQNLDLTMSPHCH